MEFSNHSMGLNGQIISRWVYLQDPIPYLMGDQLWESVLENFNQFIIDHNGASTIAEPTQERVNWTNVKNLLKSSSTITHITCE